MPSAGLQGTHRKTLAVKHQDGEPLTRVDLQYDLLYYLFSDSRNVFTDPYPTLHGEPAGTKVTFRDLYVNTLLHSSRCSKVSRDKLQDNASFADEFAKISILSNVGRINTTMAFFPEMRTALRTYHPVPSLQKTDGNLQDAPRIKNILKSCLLPTELQNRPTTPSEILNRSRSGIVPPTTIVNLIFIFSSHAPLISQTHFTSDTELDFLDFFSPVNVSSESRARALLWLCHHYYEGTTPNPFDAPKSHKKPGIIPPLEFLSAEEAALENVDTPEEKEWGEKMTAQRKIFMENKDKLDKLDETQDEEIQKERGGKRGGRSRGRGVRRGKAQTSRLSMKASSKALSRQGSSPDSSNSSGRIYDADNAPDELHRTAHYRYSAEPYRLPPIHPPNPSPPPLPPPVHAYHHSAAGSHLYGDSRYDYNRRLSSHPAAHQSFHGGPIRNHPRTPHRDSTLPPLRYVSSYEEYKDPSSSRELLFPAHSPPSTQRPYTPPRIFEGPQRLRDCPPTPSGGTRSMLEQAWHVIMTNDPLEDSEDEMDENTRLDLLLRLKIINRLRGKEPTPEPELSPPSFSAAA
ncbi:uncharacterized protein PHACADRAFT_247139 [Phanerochaete carnosa HHB-10118-sp]|uniref:Ino eighty subunit 1 n=1 Tax=Phanerochaete carnosa (strain HHB-10118-sp) TaxID=650164 RepID=K5WAG6_PHACS|nr:uncharacterized protein PHACADRAFT_247139 [Phanerochaete carnosa HHB-10118-sp]EKM60918.1 hypothetical protein PHACADRAFT_247139 [Phanerochaete carnosa HHB-10118-sp]